MNYTFKKFIQGACLVILMLMANYSYAQIDVTGTVTDENNEAVIGVNVIVKGTTTGTMTDVDGKYNITVPNKEAVIIFKFIGLKTIEEVVGDRQTINVKMLGDSQKLDDVIVIAYGTTTRSNMTGSAIALSDNDLKDVFSPSVSTMLQGKVAGVYAQTNSGRPGETASINIRGKGSINTTNNPLWVIDGVIYGHEEPTINPADIEGITILKDASATSLYGSRAANGVILIQTKNPEKGASSFNVSASRGITQLSLGKFHLMNSQELYDYHKSWNTESWFTKELLKTNTDWLDIATQLGDAQEYTVSYTGGSEKISSYVSATYFNETGTVKGYELDRYSAISNLNINPAERLSFTLNLSGNYTATNNKEHCLYCAYTYLPWDNPYKADGTIVNPKSPNTKVSWFGRDESNYLYDLQYNDRNYKGTKFIFSFNGDYKITDNFTFSSMNNITYHINNVEDYTDPRATSGWATNGKLFSQYSRSYQRFTNQMLRYQNTFDKHRINTFVAWEFGDTHFSETKATGIGIAAGLRVLNATSEAESAKGSRIESARQSFLFNLQYVFDDKYMATASFNREGSSSFGKDHRYGNFWSLSAGWNIHSESFMSNINWLNILKLTASYGVVGNSPSGFPYLGYYELTGQYNGLPAAKPYQKGNPAIGWESTQSANIGLEARVFNRVSITLDLYNRLNSGLLYRVPLPAMTGYTGIWDNIGEINNKGFELVVSSDIIKNKAFEWQMDINLSYNKNEVLELYDGQPITKGKIQVKEGKDMDSWFMKIWHGVNPGNGEPLWEKVVKNADGTETIQLTNDYNEASLQFTGQKQTPDFIGGIINKLRYNNISLSFNIGFVSGIYLYNSKRELFDSDGSYPGFNNINLVGDWSRWEKPGDIATHPKPKMGGNRDAHKPSSRFLDDASYIRLRNVNLSYRFPTSLINKIKLNSATIFVTCDNLLTFTKWPGMDPETGGGYYPLAKKYLIGLTVNF